MDGGGTTVKYLYTSMYVRTCTYVLYCTVMYGTVMYCNVLYCYVCTYVRIVEPR